MKPLALEVLGNSAAFLEMKAIAKDHNKTIVEVEVEKISKTLAAELNRVLDSWGKQLIPLDQKPKMSPSQDLSKSRKISDKEFATSYQMGVPDLWDTAEGEVFDPSNRSQSPDEKVKTWMANYVGSAMQTYFQNSVTSFFTKIEDKVTAIEKNIKKSLQKLIMMSCSFFLTKNGVGAKKFSGFSHLSFSIWVVKGTEPRFELPKIVHSLEASP